MANGDSIATLPNDQRLHPVIAELLRQMAVNAKSQESPEISPSLRESHRTDAPSSTLIPSLRDSRRPAVLPDATPPAGGTPPPVMKKAPEVQQPDRMQMAQDLLDRIIAKVPVSQFPIDDKTGMPKRTKADMIGAFLNPLAAGFGAAMAQPHHRNMNRAFWGGLVGTGVPSAFNLAALPQERAAANVAARQQQLKTASEVLKSMTPLAREEALEPVQEMDENGNMVTVWRQRSQAEGRQVGARPSGVNPAKSSGAIIEVTGPNNELIGTYNKITHQGWHLDGTPFTKEELQQGESAGAQSQPTPTVATPQTATPATGGSPQTTKTVGTGPAADLQRPETTQPGTATPIVTPKKGTALFGRRGQPRPVKPSVKQEWLPDPSNPKQEVLTNIEDGKIAGDVVDAKGKSRVRPSPLSRYETEALFRKSLAAASGDAASKADTRKGEAFDAAKKVLDWAQSHDGDPDGSQRKLLKSQGYDDSYIDAQLGPSLKNDPVALYKKGIEGIYAGASTDKAKAAIPMVERYMYDQLNLRFRNLTPDQRKAMLEMMMGGGGMPAQ